MIKRSVNPRSPVVNRHPEFTRLSKLYASVAFILVGIAEADVRSVSAMYNANRCCKRLAGPVSLGNSCDSLGVMRIGIWRSVGNLFYKNSCRVQP